MVRATFLVGVASALLVCGCSSVSPTQVGQTAGTLAGGMLVPGPGAPLGALVGTLAGLVVEHQMDKVREKKERVELSQELQKPASPLDSSSSEQLLGQPTRVWIDEQFERGRLTAGHFELRTIR